MKSETQSAKMGLKPQPSINAPYFLKRLAVPHGFTI